MNKAGYLMRRSSAKLKSLSAGHGQLLMILSQIKQVRSCFKSFVTAQSVLSEDLLKWSTSIQNEALRETFVHLSELSLLWTEVQTEFIDEMKNLKSNFELLLEGEKHVDDAKQTYSSKEESVKELRKKLQKTCKKSPSEEIQALTNTLNQTEKSKKLAHMELTDRIRENEAVRMIRVKHGMTRLSCTYLDMLNKGNIVFSAHHKVSSKIPDVHNKAVHRLRYTGNSCAHYVEEAKDKISRFRKHLYLHQNFTTHEPSDPPPPYSPCSTDRMNNLVQDVSSGSLTNPMNNLSRDLSSSSLTDERNNVSSGSFDHPSAPSQSMSFLRSPSATLYPSLNPIEDEVTNPLLSNENEENVSSEDSDMYFETLPNGEVPLLELRATEPSRNVPNENHSADSTTTSQVPTNPNFEPPPPYNPFYEWSSFPPTDN